MKANCLRLSGRTELHPATDSVAIFGGASAAHKLEGVVGVAQEGDAIGEIRAGKSARRVDKDLIEREANAGASGSESVQFLPEEARIVERTEKDIPRLHPGVGNVTFDP